MGERSRAATARLKEAEAEQAGLPEELRQAGGLPGWLRGGGPCLEAEPLPAPGQEAPAFGDGVHLSWRPVQRASFYVVEVQCLDCCGLVGECDIQSFDVTSTSLEVPFEAGRSGRWCVRALDGSGTPGEWSEWQSFERPAR